MFLIILKHVLIVKEILKKSSVLNYPKRCISIFFFLIENNFSVLNNPKTCVTSNKQKKNKSNSSVFNHLKRCFRNLKKDSFFY